MTNPMQQVLADYQKRIESLTAENESLRTQLHQSAQREDRDLNTIRELEQRLAGREVSRAA